MRVLAFFLQVSPVVLSTASSILLILLVGTHAQLTQLQLAEFFLLIGGNLGVAVLFWAGGGSDEVPSVAVVRA
jgi:hypothetical protein